ncbi:hypothetical protein [Actinoplanes rectilineatus]|uniref:hypothetical protein n=1 Tax=Actinoplanes rectilineatus TaxID=113571 RepID=UPI000A6CB052|nr:hypothetical protein [Actinoplanes rectilineatus]
MNAPSGIPNLAELDAVQRNVMAVSRRVDELVRAKRPATGDQVADVLALASGPVVDAMISLSRRGEEAEAAIALGAEMLRRLQSPGRAAQVGYEQAIATLRDVAQRTSSPAATWAADYLAVDPDRQSPAAKGGRDA